MRNRAPARGGKAGRRQCAGAVPRSAHTPSLWGATRMCRVEVLVAHANPPQNVTARSRHTSSLPAAPVTPKRQTHSLSGVLPFGKQFVAKMQHRPESTLGRGGRRARNCRILVASAAARPRARSGPSRPTTIMRPGGALIQSVDICRHAVILTSCAGSKQTW